MNITIKKWMIATVVALIIAVLPLAAFAKEYTGTDFRINIPDGDNIYYYTPDETNMSGEMLEKAREDTNVKLLTGVYGDSNGGPLLYSLKIEAQAAPADETGAVDEAAARSARLDEVKTAQAAQYTFGETTQETLGGIQADTVVGDSADYDNYEEKLWTLVYGGQIYTVTVIYDTGGEGANLALADQQLGTLAFGMPQPTPEPTLEPTPMPTASAEATALQESVPTVIEMEPMPEETASKGLGSLRIGDMEIPYLWLMIGGAAVVAVIVILAVRTSSRKRKNESWQAEQEPYGGQPQSRRNGMYPEEKGYRRPELSEEWQDALKQERAVHRGYTVGYTNGYANTAAVPGPGLQDMLPRAYWLMDAGDYIMAAKQFHECAKNSTDSAVRNVSELKTVECLKLAGEYAAAYVKARQLLLKDYGYTEEEKFQLIKDLEELRGYADEK